jgi:UDP-N-acetylglucosamine 2-epimerase (non-hydrolysing)
MRNKLKVINIVGARPNFIKIKPIIAKMNKNGFFMPTLLHTGQHYDFDMSKIFFKDLSIPEPDIHLEVGSGTHAEQTGKIIIEFEKFLLNRKPDLVIVVGDVNSTLACAIAASKLSIPIAHIEAGLRSFDRRMPEEINRVVTDSLSDYLFTPTTSASENLMKEGIDEQKIHLVGNVMIDTLTSSLDKVDKSKILEKLKIKQNDYGVLTLHRPENVDVSSKIQNIFAGIEKIQEEIQIVFPAHRRTQKRIEEHGFKTRITDMRNLMLIEPMGYIDFIKLTKDSKFVLTDSGGIQEETTVLNIPCLTLRNNTERIETLIMGTNILTGTEPDRIIADCMNIMKGNVKSGKIPEMWDGKASERIDKILSRHFSHD